MKRSKSRPVSDRSLHFPFIHGLPFLLGRGELALLLSSQQLTRSNGRGIKIARQSRQTALCPQHKPCIISSGKVKVDLIFCLVLIKQLLHYLISHNQVKGRGCRGEANQYISTKSFWTVDCKFNPQMHFILGQRDPLFDAMLSFKGQTSCTEIFQILISESSVGFSSKLL